MPSSAPPRRFEAKDADEKDKPWMFDTPYSVTVLEWAVGNSSVRLWHCCSNFLIILYQSHAKAKELAAHHLPL